MNFQLQRLQQPLTLRQVARDPMWDAAKTVGFVLAGILFFYVFGEKMYLWGAANRPTPPPATDSAPAPVAPPTVIYREEVPAPSPRQSTPEERSEMLKQELRRQYGVQ